jgi:hypothetical protein
VKRLPPRSTGDEIDVYVRTYTSLLRSSGEVPVRAFEEAHEYSASALHLGAREPRPDVAAFAYAAARLPEEIAFARLVVMGQAHEQFEAAGFDVHDPKWVRVTTRGRRRPLRWDGRSVVAAFVTSVSDIDDLVPILTAYQIEWNKIHHLLAQSELGRRLAAVGADGRGGHGSADDAEAPDQSALARVLDVTPEQVRTLTAALGPRWPVALREIARRPQDLSVQLLSGAFTEYQRAALRWWSGIEPSYLRGGRPRRPPVYFVSSNTHALVNLIGGYALAHREEILEFARRRDPEGLADRFERAVAANDDAETANIAYYLLRAFLHEDDPRAVDRRAAVQRFDAESGIVSVESPGRIDVAAQIFSLASVRPDRLDPRLRRPGLERLRHSDAVILNIDYPLGMAAYHHLTRIAQGVGEVRGIYVLGKAATLNGRVGDVMISSHVFDEHSHNTYLFRNCFSASDVQPLLRTATVLDHQKALTVRGPFQQNRDSLSAFYAEGYTVLEMEAGPYLSAIYEMVSPERHPNDEIAHLSTRTAFDVGFLHYASDTPYSRRQSLLSKSLSYFGVESTYACSIAIVRRIFSQELRRLGGDGGRG